MALRFWFDMDPRTGLKRTDKLMVGNVDNEDPEYIDVSEVLDPLTTDDLTEGANNKYMTAAERTKLGNVPNDVLGQAAADAAYYPRSTNPEGYLTAASNLDASKLNGAVPESVIPDLPASKITSGTFGQARIPDLPASKITSGTFVVARIPDIPSSKISDLAAVLASYIAATQKGAANGVAPLDGNTKIAVTYIPDLDAAKIASGTIADARLPSDLLRTADKGVANGVASLDANGVLEASQVPPGLSAYLLWNGYRLYKMSGGSETYPETGDELQGIGDGRYAYGDWIHALVSQDLTDGYTPDEPNDIQLLTSYAV